jgi:hypothetical protein
LSRFRAIISRWFGKILHLSADLERHPYRRLLGVLQMVVIPDTLADVRKLA